MGGDAKGAVSIGWAHAELERVRSAGWTVVAVECSVDPIFTNATVYAVKPMDNSLPRWKTSSHPGHTPQAPTHRSIPRTRIRGYRTGRSRAPASTGPSPRHPPPNPSIPTSDKTPWSSRSPRTPATSGMRSCDPPTSPPQPWWKRCRVARLRSTVVDPVRAPNDRCDGTDRALSCRAGALDGSSVDRGGLRHLDYDLGALVKMKSEFVHESASVGRTRDNKRERATHSTVKSTSWRRCWRSCEQLPGGHTHRFLWSGSALCGRSSSTTCRNQF